MPAPPPSRPARRAAPPLGPPLGGTAAASRARPLAPSVGAVGRRSAVAAAGAAAARAARGIAPRAAALVASVLFAGCAAPPRPVAAPAPELAALQAQVADTERAFARTMAERDHAGFQRFLADEAVFFSGAEPLRGKAAVAAAWKRFYEAPQAPFSWQPERVQVLDSGGLAFSSGPVLDPAGRPIGRFQSVWRIEAPGVWRIVFDSGCGCP